MLKAARRSLVPTSLFIEIPSPKENQQPNISRTRPGTQERRQTAEPVPALADLEDVEPLHKSVKFLAPDTEDEDEESDQSSICQSPSWEGYGQKKKKDKKHEVERKRKEKDAKERAEREAKATKKRSSRLSKAPPTGVPPMPTVMERANSAPVLDASHYSLAGRAHRSSVKEGEVERAKPQSQHVSMAAPWSGEAAGMLHGAGQKSINIPGLQDEKDAATKAAVHSQFAYADAADPCPRMHKSYTTGPGVEMYYHINSTGSSVRNESKSSRESLPPSSSRTHMLRHVPAQQGAAKQARGRDTNTHPTTSSTYPSTNNSAELLRRGETSRERGRKNGYVRHHRDQSTERALAGFVDEQLVSGATVRSSSSSARSSSSRTRRSSITQEVKAVALRLTGKMPGSTSQRESPLHVPQDQQPDYFSSFDETHPAAEALGQPLPSPLEPTGTYSQQKQAAIAQANQASTSSNKASAGSLTASSGKTRSLKDVARAALHMAPSSPSQSPVVKPTIKPPPYYLLRQRFSSSSSVPSMRSLTLSSSSTTKSNQPPRSSRTQPSPTTVAASSQPAVRVSEGSSASSNYDDGSPLPSTVTTPESSRPQSVQEGSEPQDRAKESTTQDDARTLRSSADVEDGERSSDTTPREEKDEVMEGMSVKDDDTDAKSTSSDYEDAEEMPAQSVPTLPTSPATVEKKGKTQWLSESGDSFSIPYHFAKQASQPNLVDIGLRKEPLVVSSKPPLSRSRPSTAASDRTIMDSKQEGKNEEQEELEQKKRKLRKQGPDAKATKTTDHQADLVDPTDDENNAATALTSAKTAMLSARFMSPIGGFVPSYGFTSNPLFVDFGDVKKAESAPKQMPLPVATTATQIDLARAQTYEPPLTPTKAYPDKGAEPSLESPKSALGHIQTAKDNQQRQGASPPPLARSSTAPASILKSPSQHFNPPSRPQVLSVVPKQLQPPPSTAYSTSQQQVMTTEPRDLAPVAKMFVECCNCRYYHDMPAKLYECMAKPDALVEDKLRGIAGAITTMVKCPWCQHNMSTGCCAGYAAVVYIKEKLH